MGERASGVVRPLFLFRWTQLMNEQVRRHWRLVWPFARSLRAPPSAPALAPPARFAKEVGAAEAGGLEWGREWGDWVAREEDGGAARGRADGEGGWAVCVPQLSGLRAGMRRRCWKRRGARWSARFEMVDLSASASSISALLSCTPATLSADGSALRRKGGDRNADAFALFRRALSLRCPCS